MQQIDSYYKIIFALSKFDFPTFKAAVILIA